MLIACSSGPADDPARAVTRRPKLCRFPATGDAADIAVALLLSPQRDTPAGDRSAPVTLGAANRRAVLALLALRADPAVAAEALIAAL
jgi:hypothetical protein